MLNPDEFYENTHMKEYEEASRRIRGAIKSNHANISIRQYDCSTLDKYIKCIQNDLNKEAPESSRSFVLDLTPSLGFWEVSIYTRPRNLEEIWLDLPSINVDWTTFKNNWKGGNNV